MVFTRNTVLYLDMSCQYPSSLDEKETTYPVFSLISLGFADANRWGMVSDPSFPSALSVVIKTHNHQ